MINIGLIGCGYWGMNYARVFSELRESRLAAVCDADSKRLFEVNRRYPGTATLNHYQDLLTNPEIDALVISTPATNHYAVAKECLEAGKPILVEKPLCLEAGEADRLVEIAEQKQTILMVGHTFLYNPAVHKLKEYVDRDDFGPVYYLQAARTHLGLVRNDVNAMWDLAPHDVSIFNYLTGETPQWVSVAGSRFLSHDREDFVFATLGYSNGVLGHIHASWIDSNKVRTIVVVGGNKRVVFDDINPLEKIRVFEKGLSITGEVDSYGEFQLQLRDGDIISPKVETSEPLKNQCKHFLECVETGAKPFSDGRNGAEVVRVMQAMQASVAKQGHPVEVK
ncbi:MAG: gfo/Idh/MocA family oxidoreductase [bacterium]|nr:gfo/Idh/MocA family oxidoreductase [bacterium]